MVDKKENLIEITRSYSRKLSLGNYEMLDIFCSRKEETLKKDAEKISKELHEFCKQEVQKSVLDERRNQELKEMPKPSQETRIEKEALDIRTDASNSGEDEVNIEKIPF